MGLKIPKISGLSTVTKAVTAATVSGYNMFNALISDNVVSSGEWARIGAATVVTGVVTWAAPNKKPDETPVPAPPPAIVSQSSMTSPPLPAPVTLSPFSATSPQPIPNLGSPSGSNRDSYTGPRG